MTKELILVLNAGSSSLKVSSYGRSGIESWQTDFHGQIEARQLEDWLGGQSRSGRVVGVGHRVVHGGQDFSSPVVVTPQVLARLREFIHLAPLHQPHNLAAIDLVSKVLKSVPQVACFDTAFHHGRGELAELIPLPRQLCLENGLRRYGFHGISYEYIAFVSPVQGKVIVAHLGNGASLCAMENGRSVDCTMSFTPLDGLCMGTRPGAIDPGVVLYLMQQLNLSPQQIEEILYQQSGLKGISGISNDMRILLSNPDQEAKLAVDYFVRQVCKEIGGLTAIMGGLDAIIFTAGIGEHSPEIRSRICQSCRWLGIEIDGAANFEGKRQISNPDSKISAWIVPTDEEWMIARHSGELLGL